MKVGQQYMPASVSGARITCTEFYMCACRDETFPNLRCCLVSHSGLGRAGGGAGCGGGGLVKHKL